MNESEESAAFFRCPVQSDCAEADLQIGRSQLKLKLQEQSIDGFTVKVEASKVAKLRFGKPWILVTRDDQAEVHPEWMFHSPNGDIQMALRRMKDLNQSEDQGSRWNPFARRGPGRQSGQGSVNEIAFAGIVVFVFAVLSLPGLGDALGTAPRIQNAAAEVGQLAGRVVRSLW